MSYTSILPTAVKAELAGCGRIHPETLKSLAGEISSWIHECAKCCSVCIELYIICKGILLAHVGAGFVGSLPASNAHFLNAHVKLGHFLGISTITFFLLVHTGP